MSCVTWRERPSRYRVKSFTAAAGEVMTGVLQRLVNIKSSGRESQ